MARNFESQLVTAGALTAGSGAFIIAPMNVEESPGKEPPGSVLGKLARLPRLIVESWRADVVALRNWWRRRGARIDFVVLELSGPLPERSGPPRSFLQRQLPLPPRPLTLEALNDRLARVADAQNVRGVVVILRDLTGPGLARLQNVRRSFTRVQEAGKEIVVYTPYLDLAHYYIASAADKVYAPPGAQFDVVGLYSEAVFLRDALQKVGIEAEVLQISPYKTAGNTVSQSQITPEQRQQMEWLIDDAYETITADLAQDRAMRPERIRQLIDSAPFTAEKALAAGLVDGLAYEDELPAVLAADAPQQTEEYDEDATVKDGARVKLLPWERARPLLMETVRHPSERTIGVINIEGAIVMGPSRQPPVPLPIPFVGGVMVGEETLVQLLRRAEQDEKMAALILHVDSGGGSSLASELIWRQITRVAARKPVLAYMGNVAASGGYFVSAGARHIMCQKSTITGSIGVLLVRMNLSGLLEKTEVNRTGVQRGEHADLYRDPGPLDAEERALLWTLVEETYEQFKRVVRDARGLDEPDLELVAGGRVWTGKQALEHELVDSHGDFVDALHRAAEISGLRYGAGHRLRVTNLTSRSDSYIAPGAADTLEAIAATLSTRQWRSLNGRVLALSPIELRFF